MNFSKFNFTRKENWEVIDSPTPKPVFIYDEAGKQQVCYVRLGNSSKPYNLDEFMSILKDILNNEADVGFQLDKLLLCYFDNFGAFYKKYSHNLCQIR
jgi:hypothetical protein